MNRRLVVSAAAVMLGAVLVAAGCGLEESASFDPSASCGGVAQQQMKGAYPELEARIPLEVAGKPATSRDSGRHCSRETLGSIFDAGVTEVRYGGGIWEVGDRGGIQLGAFEGDGLTAEMLAEENRRAAVQSRGTEAVRATTLEVDGRPAWRIDVVNRNSRQAIVVWSSADGKAVQLVVAADVDEAELQDAVAAFR
jgi:hypothetical protein